MVPIYLFNDNDVFRAYFLEQIGLCIMLEKYNMKVVCETANPNLLLEILQKQASKGIYFLDAGLKNGKYDAVLLAEKIQKTDEHGFIIFLTNHNELIFEILHHHSKPINHIARNSNENVMKKIKEYLNIAELQFQDNVPSDTAYYSVNIFGATHHLPLKDILFFATSQKKHRLFVCCENEVLEFFESLSNVEKVLGNGFLRIHRRYLVNQEKISRFHSSKNLIELKDGTLCTVSRMLKKEIRQIVLRYIVI